MMGEDETTDTDPKSFNNKSVWARISVIAAGPVFNLILAWIMSVIIILAAGYTTAEIGEVTPGYSAEEQGMQAGDVIKEINGRNVHIWDDLRLYTAAHPMRALTRSSMRETERNIRFSWSCARRKAMFRRCWDLSAREPFVPGSWVPWNMEPTQ